MLDLSIKILEIIFIILVVLFILAMINYLKQSKGARPIRILRKMANINKRKINKKNVYIITPKEKLEKSPTILYFHGGAYVGGITKKHWRFIFEILKDTNATFIFPDYPLIPKNTYKDVFNIAEQIYKEMIKEHSFILMGDSAGGGISLALTQKMGMEEIKQPSKTILISPWLDVSMKNKEIDEIQKYDKELNKITLKLAGEVYCGKEGVYNYLVSPINGPVDKLNNLYIFTGTYDILNPDVKILLKKINKEKVYLYEKEKAIHNWIIEDTKNSKEDYEKLIEKILEKRES